MSKTRPSALAVALTYFRSSAGLSMGGLAQRLGHSDKALISAYERGAKPLSREQLDSLIASIGYPPDAVDVFLFAHDLIHETLDRDSSLDSGSPAERRSVSRAAMAAAWTAGRIAAEAVSAEQKSRRKSAGMQEANELAKGLLKLGARERVAMVEAFPTLWSQALALKVCEASLKSAPMNAEEALELAQLAVSIAERVPGEEGWRSRLLGYCWAHVANARRVANNLVEAEETFAKASKLWQMRSDSGPHGLEEWLLPAMEASLRRAQRRFSEALELLGRARSSPGGTTPAALLMILLNEANVYSRMGEPRRALEVLAEAAPLCEASGDRQMLLALRFNMADDFCELERFDEAAQLLPQVRELAFEQGNELDLIRVNWLSARIAAGQGRVAEALAGLEEVSEDFRAHKLPYNAALSSLDMAVLLLKIRKTAEVKRLSTAMGWIFKAKGVDREALMALSLFCNAARQETATVEMALRARADVEQARRLAPPK